VKVFEIESRTSEISLAVSEIIKSSSKLFSDLYLLEIAVYEAVFNAIEHGNLEITGEEKRTLLEKGKYDLFLNNLIEKFPCSKRKVKITSTVDTEKQVIEIKDQGRGFDWEKALKTAEECVGCENERFNGFGLRIISSVFDKVLFNDKGNVITLIKYCNNVGGCD
jgi:anti-sigma regulatory factor (Ser/Thr protein kinase)